MKPREVKLDSRKYVWYVYKVPCILQCQHTITNGVFFLIFLLPFSKNSTTIFSQIDFL